MNKQLFKMNPETADSFRSNILQRALSELAPSGDQAVLPSFNLSSSMDSQYDLRKLVNNQREVSFI